MSAGSPLAEIFRGHFGHREHLYGVLLEHLADDFDAGGVTAEICRDHLQAGRGDATSLRLLAGIFRLVLDGSAPQLRPFYPCLGGAADPERVWPVARPVLATHVERLRAALDLVPQTNEVGRAACLALGLFAAVRRYGLRRVRLLELGASAGLNLNVDRYRVVGPGWGWGPADSSLELDTEAAGVHPEQVEIVQRRGCDLSPVDVTTRVGADHLTSFVWPFDLDRHRQLAAAIEVARAHRVVVDRATAAVWIERQLAAAVAPRVLTVVWHSISEQYWPAAETEAVRAAIDSARSRGPVAHVAMEGLPPVIGPSGYSVGDHGPRLTLDEAVLARSHHHGPPVVLATGVP